MELLLYHFYMFSFPPKTSISYFVKCLERKVFGKGLKVLKKRDFFLKKKKQDEGANPLLRY